MARTEVDMVQCLLRRSGERSGIGGTSATYGYDQADRLTSYGSGSTSATYTYNGDGLRTNKAVNGVTQPEVWDLAEGMPIMLTDGTNSYVTGPDGLPIEQVNGTGVTYLYQDQLGSTRGLLDGSGNTVGTYTYGPFGDVQSHTGTATTPFGYAGQYTDADSGLQYLRARYYDSSTGQFLTVDPLVAITGEAYSYAADAPINNVDPSGLDCSLGNPAGCAGNAGGWLYNSAGSITFGSSLIAGAASRAAFLEPVVAIAGGVSIVAGAFAAYKDYCEGSYIATGLDILGIVPGVASVTKLAQAGYLEDASKGYAELAASATRYGRWDWVEPYLGEEAKLNNAARTSHALSDFYGHGAWWFAGAAWFAARGEVGGQLPHWRRRP